MGPESGITPSPRVSRQTTMYLRGSAVDLPVSWREWRARAKATLSRGPFDYIAGGAGQERTMRANREAFDRRRIWPRMLRDVSTSHLEVTVLGTRFPSPFALAPVGVQSIIHPDGDLAPARAAAEAQIPFVLSTLSSVPLESVAEAMGDAPRWFQLYPSRDPEIMASIIHRAEAAGYTALVVTVDTQLIGWRERDLRNAYLPFLQMQGLANYLSDPVFRSRLPGRPEDNPQGTVMLFLSVYGNPAFSWGDLGWLCREARLPILVKGIQRPDDAVQALERGASGLIVSNHGGRQVDGAVGSLDALDVVVSALGGRAPILFDSGIRTGADVIKALALGADAVLLGRPYLYALAAAGETGVREVIANLSADIGVTAALAGCSSRAEIDRSLLAP